MALCAGDFRGRGERGGVFQNLLLKNINRCKIALAVATATPTRIELEIEYAPPQDCFSRGDCDRTYESLCVNQLSAARLL